MVLYCDVLVVGCGPSGAASAYAAAKKGLKVVCIEKKHPIGVPVQCAEAVSSYLIKFLPFKIPRELLVWRTNGVIFYIEDKVAFKRVGGLWGGYAINRIDFDQRLAKKAISAGAKVMDSTELLSMQFDEDRYVSEVTVKVLNKKLSIVPRMLIAADGVESKVLHLLGVYKAKEGDFAPIYSWEMRNLMLDKPNFEHVFVGNFANNGYGYIFPKSRTTANIGVGAVFQTERMDKKFEKFVSLPDIAKQMKSAAYASEKSKIAPFDDISKKWVYGNTILVGDAANQNIKPFVEGYLPAIICGNFVGENIFDIINKNVDYVEAVKHLVPGFEESARTMKEMYKIFRSNREDKAPLLLDLISEIDWAE